MKILNAYRTQLITTANGSVIEISNSCEEPNCVAELSIDGKEAHLNKAELLDILATLFKLAE